MRLLVIFAIILFLIPAHSIASEARPWITYKLITQIYDDLHEICNAKNINTTIDYVELDKNKTPTDVYEQSYILLEKIQKLSQKKSFETNKEVLLPKKKEGRKIPSDVAELLTEISQVTKDMRGNARINNQEFNIEEEPSITPPYVYQKVIKTIALVNKLL